MLLSDILDLPILREAGLRVVAGNEHVHRPVSWVHTGEIADIARYLSGGEVLLTAGTGLIDAAADRRSYINELVGAGAAAVIVELGRAFREIPAEMTEEAELHGLVLVELEHEIPFVAVTQQVHKVILNEHHAALERATEIGDELSRLLLDGTHMRTMLEVLSERLGNPVALEDGSHRVVAFGQSRGSIKPILAEWQRHSRFGHQRAAVGVQAADSEPRCVWSSVALRGEVWGRLHVLEVDSPLDSLTRLALGRAASSIALYLLSERDAYLSDEAERSLVTDVAHGANFSGDAFLTRATGLGVDFSNELVVLVVAPIADQTGKADDLGETVNDVQRVRDALREARWPSVVASLSGQVVAVVASDQRRGMETALEALVAQLSLGGPPYHLGVSRPARASLLRYAYAEAQAAYELGPVSSAEQQVHRFESLVLHRLLEPIAKAGPHLANFVESELGELITYDEKHGSDLLHTLDVYLRNNGSKAATAGALYLQRRSVYYRLSRIEELLDRSIEPASHRVRLYLALRAREMMAVRALGDF